MLGTISRQPESEQAQCIDIDGFCFNSALTCSAQRRCALPQLWRHVTCPPLGT